MAKHYQDFVGLNTFIYEPVGFNNDKSNLSTSGLNFNHIGHFGKTLTPSLVQLELIPTYKNDDFLASLVTTTPNDSDFFNLLMSHRGNVYGYPTWRQVRVSHNPLTRKQRKENIFTHAPQPGPRVSNGISTYGATKIYRE